MTAHSVTQVPVYEVRKVRFVEVREACADATAAVAIARRELAGLDREHVLAIYLNAQNMVMGFETVTIGFENGATMTMTALFRGALLAGARSLILAHNHPSGDVQASREDCDLLVKAKAAGKVLGCPIMDFLIVADDGRYSDIGAIERVEAADLLGEGR